MAVVNLKIFHKCDYVTFGKFIPPAINYDIRSGSNYHTSFTPWTCTDNDCLPALY